jgi:hypothetical protein
MIGLSEHKCLNLIIPLYIYRNNNILVIIKEYNLKQIVVDMNTSRPIYFKCTK